MPQATADLSLYFASVLCKHQQYLTASARSGHPWSRRAWRKSFYGWRCQSACEKKLPTVHDAFYESSFFWFWRRGVLMWCTIKIWIDQRSLMFSTCISKLLSLKNVSLSVTSQTQKTLACLFWHVATSLTSTMFWHFVTSLKSTTSIVAWRRARRCSREMWHR